MCWREVDGTERNLRVLEEYGGTSLVKKCSPPRTLQ
jgi:hypothetical protein